MQRNAGFNTINFANNVLVVNLIVISYFSLLFSFFFFYFLLFSFLCICYSSSTFFDFAKIFYMYIGGYPLGVRVAKYLHPKGTTEVIGFYLFKYAALLLNLLTSSLLYLPRPFPLSLPNPFFFIFISLVIK